ncbi:MAG: S8 family serine peptidase [Rhodanobacteraceae bacterium]
MWKVSFVSCNPQVPPIVVPIFNNNAADRAQAQVVDGGVQAISMSFGTPYDGQNWCQSHRSFPECLSSSYAVSRDTPMVAASGNRRTEINFPASDKRVISAGGFQQDLAFWDDSPGNALNCPAAFPGECGSNYSKLHSGFYLTHQELIGSAKRVLSTTYPNTTWVDYAECGDGYGTPMGDGIGWCTGTSMSAPQIAGVVGLLRSINPLVPASEPEPAAGVKPGLRTVLAQTASRGQLALGWAPTVGYGVPDAAAAARRMLGNVVGVPARNRATPLFRLFDAATRDFADTVSPQSALSLMITQVHNYAQPTAGLGAAMPVPGYAFPYDANDPNEPDNNIDAYESIPAIPRAPIYVLTTEYRPHTEWPALVPLFLMDRDYPSGKDYMLVTTTAEIQTAYNGGALGASYNLRTIQGYIYQSCTPEPQCIPPGAQKLWREYKPADNDCAVFLDSEKAAFEANGYSSACPAGPETLLGYAYPSTDTDNDGLLDGFEYTVGTNPNAADSDGDGMPDATEFPMDGVAVSDPCMGGPLGAKNCGADVIFRNGFQLP